MRTLGAFVNGATLPEMIVIVVVVGHCELKANKQEMLIAPIIVRESRHLIYGNRGHDLGMTGRYKTIPIRED